MGGGGATGIGVASGSRWIVTSSGTLVRVGEVVLGGGMAIGGVGVAGGAGNNIWHSIRRPGGGGGPNFTKEMLSKSRVIARGPDIRKIEELIRKFGGTRKGWVKKSSCDSLGNEWHWYEHNGIGRVGEKPAGDVDPF